MFDPFGTYNCDFCGAPMCLCPCLEQLRALHRDRPEKTSEKTEEKTGFFKRVKDWFRS